MSNNNRNINNIYYIFITAHLIFWTFIPSITNHNLPLDTIEALAWGSNLDWGFNKHPPMSAFFSEVFFQIFGSQDWIYYLLSQIFVLTSFYYVFKFSKEFFNNDLLGLISVLLIEAIYFYNFTTPEFNVNVCQLPFWSLTVYFSWKIYNSKEVRFTDCFLVGLFAAFGFLSKYLFIYLLASIDLLFVYLIFIKKDRKFDFKYLITLEVFLIVLVPHLIWLNNNEFITITYGLARTGLEQSSLIDHIKFPLIFLIKQVGLLIPFLILVWLLIKKIKFKFDLKDKRLLFLLAINILPILLMFLTSVVTGSKIRTMWMTPFYLFFGTLFIYVFQSQINIKKLKPFMIGFIFLFFLSPILYAYVSISKDDKRTDYPGKEIAIKTQYAWDQQFKSKINVVYGNEWNAGNLSYHLKSRPVWEGIVDREKLDRLKDYMCLDNVCVGSK
ncbi:glycosyltransferase family 39 protein [uncultured Candidatus Pelagibacter sp.]|jgi:4-amino-4-deoxy-L-arabinose transferase-like glycosyltransferase|uniref:glycosyltransferase family 39 protein n=1 Tax=uncultured Candidatus Pelagibacter sp. TaxID=372654 RepID=UPI00236E3A59|nr:glycosyltransferase family 39 protein [uncultured Candidatus Pelagibacter sp.]MDB4351233.1 glycosyltransferase family 39 protein [Candidatus Pelagibacter sp.]